MLELPSSDYQLLIQYWNEEPWGTTPLLWQGAQIGADQFNIRRGENKAKRVRDYLPRQRGDYDASKAEGVLASFRSMKGTTSRDRPGKASRKAGSADRAVPGPAGASPGAAKKIRKHRQ